jgi:hypothetical protein
MGHTNLRVSLFVIGKGKAVQLLLLSFLVGHFLQSINLFFEDFQGFECHSCSFFLDHGQDFQGNVLDVIHLFGTVKIIFLKRVACQVRSVINQYIYQV